MIMLCVCETRKHVSLFHKICLYVLKTDIEEHVKQLLLKPNYLKAFLCISSFI